LTVILRSVYDHHYDHKNFCSALCNRIRRSLYCARSIAQSGRITGAIASEASGA
jgi:hypothetical protein